MSTGVVNPSAGISPTSIVLNYAFCVFAASLLMLFVFAHFIAEPILMPKAYKHIYRDMSPANRRSFTCHHVWLLVVRPTPPAPPPIGEG